MPASLYLCVHLRDFAAQALVCSDRALHSRAVAVLSGEPPLERVFAMTQQARQLGMEEGMSRVHAESFSVGVVRRDRRQEDRSFAELMQCTKRFSPQVETISSPQEESCGATLVLDVTGSERLLGSAAQIGATLWGSVCAFGYEASVASAHRASVALLAARGTLGVTTIAPGCEAETLAPLPLSVLEPDVITVQIFESWGIHNLRQLAALPTKPLAARLGQSGLRLQQLARGECSSPLVPTEEPVDAPLMESMELEHPVELLEPLLFLLSQILEQLLQRAAQRALAIASVETCLVLDGPSNAARNEHRRMVRPTLPERGRLTLLKLIQLDLEQHPPEAAVIGVRVTAYPARAQTAQHGLFAAQAPEAGHMEILLARLRKLVGEGRVGAPELLDSHVPEAFRIANFEIAQTSLQPSVSTRLKSPVPALRMVRPPCAVDVEVQGDSPSLIEYEGRRLRLQTASGPWRTSGAWWTHPAWCREEWEVVLKEQPQRCLRLAHDPAANCWYVIGIYD
jgi:protein ImuB